MDRCSRFGASEPAARERSERVSTSQSEIAARKCHVLARTVPRALSFRSMSEITQWLQQASSGDPAALGRVFDELYPELKRIARMRADGGERTLSPTVLINEAFMRLLGSQHLSLNDRRHFLACAARAMRGIVVDHIRWRTADKRGGPGDDVSLDALPFELGSADDAEVLALDSALKALDAVNPRQREVVELRYFAGLEFAEVALLLECSERTAKREWERARAFLYAQMRDE